jgi:hypothetical protein
VRTINVYVDGPTYARLRQISDETGRSVEDLAESAVSEAALDAFRHRKDDPAKGGAA